MVVAQQKRATPATRARVRPRDGEGPGSANTSGLSQAGPAPGRAGFFSYACAAILIVGSLVFYVSLRVHSLDLGYQLTRLRQQQMQLVLDNRALHTEVSTLSAPARIRKLAIDRMGMVPALQIVEIGSQP